MKKIYLKPEMISLNVVSESIIATSGGSDTDVPVGGWGDADANKHRGEWGNVWGQ